MLRIVRDAVQQKIKELNDKTEERTKTNMLEQITKKLSEENISNQNEINEKVKVMVNKIKTDNMIQVARENGHLLKTTFDSLKYEAVLNKNQY